MGILEPKNLTASSRKESATGRRGPKKPLFYWVFPGYPCTEALVIEASQNAGPGHEISRNFTATCLVLVIFIKQLGHAVPLAKALVEGGSTSGK
jgi:hypothetical protein